MQVLIRSKDFPVTAAIQQFAQQQASKMLKNGKKLRIIRVETFLEKTRATCKATIKAVLPGQNIVVERNSNDIYLAIADALRRTKRVLRKQKEKTTGRNKN